MAANGFLPECNSVFQPTALDQGGLGLLLSSAGLFAGFICPVSNLYQFRLKVCYLFIQITRSLREQIVSLQFASHVSGL